MLTSIYVCLLSLSICLMPSAALAAGADVSDDGKLLARVNHHSIRIIHLESNKQHRIDTGWANVSLGDPSELEKAQTLPLSEALEKIRPTFSFDLEAPAWDVAFLPGSSTLYVLTGGGLLLLDGVTGQRIREIRLAYSGHTLAGQIAVASDAKRAAFTEPKDQARIVDLETGKVLHTLRNVRNTLDTHNLLEFDPSGEMLATIAQDGSSAQIWNVATGKLLGTLAPPPVERSESAQAEMVKVTCLTWVPGTRLLILGAGSDLLIYDASTFGLKRSIRVEESIDTPRYSGPWAPISVSVAPNGKSVLVVGGKSIPHTDVPGESLTWFGRNLTVWDIDTGKVIKRIETSVSPPPCVHFFKDGRQILVHDRIFAAIGHVIDLETGAVTKGWDRTD